METHEGAGEITAILDDWAQGHPDAVDRLFPLVYDQLRRQARSLIRDERSDHTLQGTALVNELFAKFIAMRKVSIKDRGHFYTFSAKLMRRVLVDYARKSKALKRGTGFLRVPLEAELSWVVPKGETSLDLSRALDELGQLNPNKAHAVELVYFLGCTVDETAELLSVSASTVDRDIRFSLAWLHERLHPVR
jgi:RNA polymerase sigma factor (TIGR02999 family)